MKFLIQYQGQNGQWLNVTEYEFPEGEVDKALADMSNKFDSKLWRKYPAPNSALFSIYTNCGGHNVMGFSDDNAGTKPPLEQVREFAKITYVDPADPPSIYKLTYIGTLKPCGDQS